MPAGLSSHKFEQEVGRVDVSLARNGEKIIDFFAPEWITDNPYRTDRIIYSISSEFARFHRDIFGDLPPAYSREYNRDSTEIRLDMFGPVK